VSWDATVLSDGDNVGTLLRPVVAGESVSMLIDEATFRVNALEPIALCHKIALRPIECGERVVKYGECIGEATHDIPAGAWVHIHNLRSCRAQPRTSP
jgi:hypothetical protein